MKKDNHLMALLSVWGILLVVIGHSGFNEPIVQENLGWLHSWVYSFHMPLFFMISGYLFSLTNKSFVDIDAGKFLWKKVLRLLVPYVTIGTVVYLIKFALSNLSYASRDYTLGNFLYMFIAPESPDSTMGYLWYIITLFVVFAIVVLLNKMRVDMKKTAWCVSVIVAAFILRNLMPRMVLCFECCFDHMAPAFDDGLWTYCKNTCGLDVLFVVMLCSYALREVERMAVAMERQDILNLYSFLVRSVCRQGAVYGYPASALGDCGGCYVYLPDCCSFDN